MKNLPRGLMILLIVAACGVVQAGTMPGLETSTNFEIAAEIAQGDHGAVRIELPEAHTGFVAVVAEIGGREVVCDMDYLEGQSVFRADLSAALRMPGLEDQDVLTFRVCYDGADKMAIAVAEPDFFTGWQVDRTASTAEPVQTTVQAAADRSPELPIGQVSVHPNPFNPETSFNLKNMEGPVEVEIYNVAGRLVWSYRTEVAGEARIRWNGMDNQGQRVSSGTYLYSVVNHGLVHQGKLTMVK